MYMMVGDTQNQNQGQADILSATSSLFTKANLSLTFLALRRKKHNALCHCLHLLFK